MPLIELNDQEFNTLVFVLANAEGKGITWTMINPLIMALQRAQDMTQRPLPPSSPVMKRPRDGNKESHHE